MPLAADRRPIVWAFSTSRLRRVFESVAPLLASTAEVRVFDKGYEEALDTVRSLMAAGEQVDALVAAGANGAYLRDHAGMPVVVVIPSTLDVLQAVVQARKLSSRIGVVNFGRAVAGLEQGTGLIGVTAFEQRPYVTPEDAKAHVDDLAARGFEVIVGPGPVCELAERAGLEAVLIYGHDSLADAIRQAADVARLARAEGGRRALLQAVLDRLEPGVVAVDRDERIVSLNPALQRLLGVTSGEVLGRRLSAVAPDLSLASVLETGAAELDVVRRVGNHALVTRALPMQVQGVEAGALLTCHDAAVVQRLERSLRARHRPARFVARHTRDHPFVAVNCAAFPETLLESELFGYEEGAFTGSRRGGRPGLFEAAHLGTIFLDEVGDVPLTLQTRLLRVLQEREVLRLGSNDPTPVDVRVIAATHRDLREEIAAGRFREDLYYRLDILRVHIPPLRERPGDVADVAAELLKRALLRHGAPEAHRRALELVLPRLEGYAWPGNVRELENVLERVAVLFADRAAPAVVGEEEILAAMPEVFERRASEGPGLRAARGAQERAHIRRVLEACGGDPAEAARRLGIGRSTLYRKLGGGR